MIAAYGSSGGSDAGYWILVAIVALVVLGLIWWALNRMRARSGGSGPSDSSSSGSPTTGSSTTGSSDRSVTGTNSPGRWE